MVQKHNTICASVDRVVIGVKLIRTSTIHWRFLYFVLYVLAPSAVSVICNSNSTSVSVTG